MTLKVTERDKKILIVLGIVLVILGLTIGVLMPLAEDTQELSEKITEAEIEKQEKEMKVVSLPGIRTREEQSQKDLAAMQDKYYPVMKSVEIDRMMTNTAVNCGIQVTNMDIKMPDFTAYTTLPNYSDLVYGTEQENSEKLAADMIISQKRMGGLQAVRAPFFPPNALLITRLDNLSIYWQEDTRRRSVIDNPKRDRIENFESVNEAYVVEDYRCAALVENIQIGDFSAAAAETGA